MRWCLPVSLPGFHDLSLWPKWINVPFGAGLSEWNVGLSDVNLGTSAIDTTGIVFHLRVSPVLPLRGGLPK